MDPAPDAGQLRDDAVDAFDAFDASRLTALGHQNLEHNLDFINHHDRHDYHDHHGHHRRQSHSHTISISIQSQPESLPYTDSDLGHNFDDGISYDDGLAVGSAQANIPDSYSTIHYHDPSISTRSNHHAPPPQIDPDDFYKNYRRLDASTGPDILPMATTSFPRPSLRSNGDGTTPKHPAVSVARSLPRANLRSVSSPLDTRTSTTRTSPGNMPAGKPSVKDLKKRFDQNATMAAPTIPPTISRAALVSKPVRPRNDELEHGNPHAATNPGTRQSQGSGVVGSSSIPLRHSKFIADDHASTSPQSFASRIGKPRSHGEGEVTSPPQNHHQLPGAAPAGGQSQGLLFGEVLPDQVDPSSVGFGIDVVRPRRTSESSIQNPPTHHRTFSGPSAAVGATSPTSWYRGPSSQIDEAPDASASRHRPRPHSRARSDDGSSSPSSRATRNARTKPSTQSSKLPVSVRKFNNTSNSTSPSSTRSSSPSTLKRYQANGRPASRTSPVATRAKTPTQTRKPPPQGLVTPSSSNARLQAFIAAPAPKLSPTLRSSRPRQPVSLATTTSSRMKESDKAKLARPGESSSRRRKISVGPIDFEQRREHIRLAYTKSIRASEALEARHQAEAAKRRRELEAAADIQQTIDATSPDVTKSGDPVDKAPVAALDTSEPPQDSNLAVTDSLESAEPAKPLATPPLTISTKTQTVAPSLDSPTLGLPGSFPDQTPPMIRDGPPLSAISATSDTTEFDVEPQTNPPVAANPALDVPITVVKPPSPQRKPDPPRPRTEYQYPFEDETGSPVNVSPQKDRTEVPTHDFHHSPAVPGSFVNDEPESTGLGIGSIQSQVTSTTLVLASQPLVTSGSDDTQTVPFPRLEADYDSDCQTDSERLQRQSNQVQIHREDDAVTDTCTEETDDRERPDMQPGSFQDDPMRSYRTSTCASSEADTYDDRRYSSYEQQQHLGTPASNNYLMPNSRYHDERFSRQSAWTDFSVDSTDHSDPNRSPAVPSSRESPAFGHVTIFSSKAESSSIDARHNSQLGIRDSQDSRRSSAQYSSHHLPEIDTGDGFSVPYLPHQPSDHVSYVPSPIHEPPPIPTSLPGSDLNSRTSSAFYDQAQYESTLLNSDRGSDEYMSHAGTTRSVDSTSLATTDQYASTQTPADSDTKSLAQEGEELSDKERHRLGQRRNVIKELVDTEAVFVRDMNIVEEIYKGTAEACPKLDSKTVKLIFRNSDEIIAFHTSFLAELKDAVADVYVPKGPRTMPRDDSSLSAPSFTASGEPNDAKDRSTSLGPVFKSNIEQMKLAHEGFLRASDQAAKRLIQIQQDPTVQVWLNECNEVAKDLTAAWDLDSLLIKPMQRITKYPNLLITLLQHTPQDHPDRESLLEAKDILETAIIEINKTKKNFELVGQIVGRKRKESDVKAGFARAFGKRVDKLQASNNRPAEDAEYAKLNEKFGDDYLRLQVVLRDVEFYTRQVSAYVHEFLQYMSSIELVMRLQPGNYPELESKWVQFNISVRDLEKVALEDHLTQVRKRVIEPFEHVIKAYGNPSLAMKKRQKRRVDYERFEQLRRSGKSPDPKLKELVEQYEALNDTLKKELPQLSALTEKVGNICLGNFVNIQANWYAIWKEKMKTVLPDYDDMPDLHEVVSTFQQDFPYAHDQMAQIGILNPATWGRTSLSTSVSVDDTSLRTRGRPSDVESRSRGQSINGDGAPTLPTPDFGGRRSGSFTMSPSHSTPGFANGNVPSPHQYYYRDYYAGIHHMASPKSPDAASSSRSGAGAGAGAGMVSTRPSTGRSYESGVPRQSLDSAAMQQNRDSTATFNSSTMPQETQREPQRFSNIFHSALPMSDGPDECSSSQRASRASSRERSQTSDGYNVLWLAASLFEFNISTTKHEAGYPYLTYQAGEVSTQSANVMAS